MIAKCTRSVAAFLCAFVAAISTPVSAQQAQQHQSSPDLLMAIVVMRHGVRSPTHPAELQPYAARPWPSWEVKGGYLTPHGALLMRQFGAYYRGAYGALAAPVSSGCPAKDAVFIWADVDERTLATGKAIATGFAPGCTVVVGHASGDNDPLFDPLPALGTIDKIQSRASIAGAIGADPGALTIALNGPLASMESVLGCSTSSACKQIASAPTSIGNDGDGGLATMSGALDVAADVAENFLLEYTDGKPMVGWGKVDQNRLVELMQLHVLNKRLEHGNRYTSRAHASNIMAHILETLQQRATSAKVAGTLVPTDSRLVFLVGHDTQLAELSGLLQLSWLVRGDQMNDTPPGSALVFELHGSSTVQPFVRTFFTEQSLDAMRAGRGEHPLRVPVYVPGCPSFDCPLDAFARIVTAAIDPAFVAPWK